jgi:hypothetical protein
MINISLIKLSVRMAMDKKKTIKLEKMKEKHELL